ncbi:hypothetical protein Pcinc_037476 [Petrolisthes cinctipes]|uniref:DNA ligase 4 n=1 Tax=Petrolisthes cinctipes TaxID=88211 RepID=A0AAE1BSA1_PETCI|nr:hypothetical protein Pcinc_037476 [Petrolisthes cinctipes]
MIKNFNAKDTTTNDEGMEDELIGVCQLSTSYILLSVECRLHELLALIVINMLASSKPIASVIPWSQVCRMLDKVQSATRANKKDMLFKFITTFRDLHHKKLEQEPTTRDSFFPVLRVLLPALDRSRGAYGVKEHKLAKLYITILGLKKDGNDANKLLNFRKPTSSAGGESGDFGEVAYYVLKGRCPDKGDMSLHEVDAHLTSIAENHAAKKHEEVERALMIMFRKMTAVEQKWLIRVLLKDMRLGIGQTTIFNAWHPDAKDYYDVTNSLEKVCQTLQDPNVRLHEIDVSLFSAFRPMLAERAVLEKVETQMGQQTYYAETKYDGERSQIHKKGSDYKYFSRNGFDFTSNFGADRHSGLFTPHLQPQLASHVREVILDGEMVAWSKSHNIMISKGEHLDVKNLKEEGDWHVCFCAFDIIYLNGEVLTNLPLSKRLEKLKAAIIPLEGRVIISPHFSVTSKEDVVAALNIAIDQREEGLVLKDPQSVYRPASRKSGWIKVKPEYVDSLVPELDLLIIGAYYGKGRRHGCLSHFLLGVAVPSDTPGGRPKCIHSVCRVGSGYTVAELADLVERLSPYTTRQQPRGVLVTREKPDIWIDPTKSFIVQVRAAEVVSSELYQTGCTLRFPRVEKVRYDKPWYDALTTTQLHTLMQEASGKLATKHYTDGGDDPSAKRKAAAKPEALLSLPSHFRPADLSKAVKKAEIFQGLEMCVMSGAGGQSKQELETKVVEHGGTFTQHPGPKTHCIVADQMSVRVKNNIRGGQYSVVHPAWVLSCVSHGRLMPWGPLDILHLKDSEQEDMQEHFDEYGDSYTEPTDETALRRVMENMGKESWTVPSPTEMLELDEELCETGDTRGIFRTIRAFFSDIKGAKNQLISLTLRLHGGSVTQSAEDSTHVVTSLQSGLRPSELPGRHLVTVKWIYESVEAGKMLEERHFLPHCLTVE